MKKVIYYVSPFAVLPLLFLLIGWAEGNSNVSPSVFMFLTYGGLFSVAALLGTFSPADNRLFDYLMTVFVPAAMCLALFVGLMFDEGCDGQAQLSLHHALNFEYYKTWLPIAGAMAVVTFGFSFRPIRLASRLHK